ncbi:hypothetical protein [Adlercreutzia sp.]|uniref:hypothetical protein n=1 Tax=Adlercreutzia sp. TaxID=1872387 RepID=UPI002E7A6D17|nr:hypothetical protein [Adlercreutzia sp.]MEE0636528.1 hypothetical protein [Adlercreutzia sp.]
MISIAIMAETPEELAEAVRKLTEPDKLFVSASEVATADGDLLEASRRDERKTIA